MSASVSISQLLLLLFSEIRWQIIVHKLYNWYPERPAETDKPILIRLSWINELLPALAIQLNSLVVSPKKIIIEPSGGSQPTLIYHQMGSQCLSLLNWGVDCFEIKKVMNCKFSFFIENILIIFFSILHGMQWSIREPY